MSQLPISLLDLLVIGIVLLSALLASVRGFTRDNPARAALAIRDMIRTSEEEAA